MYCMTRFGGTGERQERADRVRNRILPFRRRIENRVMSGIPVGTVIEIACSLIYGWLGDVQSAR